jgi:D-aspartate ligase
VAIAIRDISTPVVILRSTGHGPLGILRTLGRCGVRVYVVDANRRTPAFFSRYCRERFLCSVNFNTELTQFLLRVAHRIGRKPILIPTLDEAAIFVAENAQILQDWFTFPRQSAELVRSLCSKKEMYCLTKKYGIATAETVFPRSREEVLAFSENALFPVVLKGIFGNQLWRRTGKRMFIVNTPRDLLEKYDAFEDAGQPNLMLQEYIPGSDDTVWMFNGYFNEHSECLLAFTGKKLRQCPVHRGATSLGICLKNETVENTTKDFMKAIGYRGILDIGYRFDARDRVYKVLDINPRIGGTFRLFVGESGIDVVSALYLDMTGQAIITGCARDGRKWVVEDLDAVSSFRYWREGSLTARQWISSFRGTEEAAYFATDDPVPLVMMGLNDAGELCKRVYRKLRGVTLERFSPSWHISDLMTVK